MSIPNTSYNQMLDPAHPLFAEFTKTQAERDNAIKDQLTLYHEQSMNFLKTAAIVNDLEPVYVYVCRWQERSYEFDEYNSDTHTAEAIFKAKRDAVEFAQSKRNVEITQEKFFKDLQDKYFKVKTSKDGFVLRQIFIITLNKNPIK